MNDLHSLWKKEYDAPFSGWDFSYLKNRWICENPPWNYKKMVRKLVKQSEALLDMETGGGEFLASLAPLPDHTRATEGWKPNVSIAKIKLEPLGVQVMEIEGTDIIPFSDGEFDTVINRHGSFKTTEVFRVLKPGGTFLTQQVGGNNLQDFAEEFDAILPFPGWTFVNIKKQLQDVSFNIKQAKEWRGNQEFMDVGAIAYFIKAIPWTAPGFNMDKNMHDLEKLQRRLDAGERLIFIQVRFLFQAQKPA